MEKFIWIDGKKHPELQNSYHTFFCDKSGYKYAVVCFLKEHSFSEDVSELSVSIFADSKYALYVNDKFTGMGPVCPGGDYGNTLPMQTQYYSTYKINNIGSRLKLYALVCLLPEVQCEQSCGRGCLWAKYTVTYKSGRQEEFCTDDTWYCRQLTEFVSQNETDFTMVSEEWEKAVYVGSNWNLRKSPIYNLTEEKILPMRKNVISDNEIEFEFDRIYAGYFCVNASCFGEYELRVCISETKDAGVKAYVIKGKDNINFRSLSMNSIGYIKILSTRKIILEEVYLMFSHYPILNEGNFLCSDPLLNKIYDVSKHTTNICRQTLELDSPKHQENLGCVGDYFIESLIAYYCFGDYSLSRFDIVRIGDYMKMTGGKMFHTSYSLIWVYMIYDYYMYSGDESIFQDIVQSMDILMELFDSYVGENGVIENPPNYMFVDWIPVDSYNLHHPPKALGQSTLNAFYYQALRIAEKIYIYSGENDKAKKMSARALNLKHAFNKCFYDENICLYTGGMNAPSEHNNWLPKNTSKVYYGKHTNTLAVLYGLCSNGKAIMEKVINDDTLIDVQPYFMHYVLEALYECGLFEKYGINEIRKWKKQIDECDKGMKEAWGNYPGYSYDFSHAWGASPAYHLPAKLLGIKILEPGFKKISINPKLYGLEYAEMELPTPYGTIHCTLSENIKLDIPPEITVVSET